LFHLVAPGEWPAAGEYAPASLAAEGFVHLSHADQVAGTANRHYRDAAELVAVELDPARLGVEVRDEDSYGSGTAYPHAYGPIPAVSAVALHPLVRGPDGDWIFTPSAGSGSGSAGR
jgi:Uncharacterized protein conserved in bacteria